MSPSLQVGEKKEEARELSFFFATIISQISIPSLLKLKKLMPPLYILYFYNAGDKNHTKG